MKKYLLILLVAIASNAQLQAQTDTLRVMAYNVLNFGAYPLCQGPNKVYHAYLQTIVQYANPDIMGLVKMGSIKTSPTDNNYSAEINFQDSILKYVLEPSYPGRFNYCPFTNIAASGTECLVFYNQQKLGFVATTCTYSNTEDFNTFKFYYKDVNLGTTHDTTFLYVTSNHDISGSSSGAQRGAQITGEMNQIKSHFTHLANMINMGDFNLRNTSEPVYQVLTNPADTNFRYYDPPFYPDAKVAYPADWDNNPNAFSKYLTTSTRASGSNPNSCGTSGGAKDWFDHIFLSPWIINSANYISYIPKSFRAVGNDGNRLGISINDAPANISAPAPVINALFQMSNKYPVMVDLLVTQNTTGVSPADPEIVAASVGHTTAPGKHVSIVNPVSSAVKIFFSEGLIGETVTIDCMDITGRSKWHQEVTVNNAVMQFPVNLTPGTYYIAIAESGHIISRNIIVR
jgi:hypothetical protein